MVTVKKRELTQSEQRACARLREAWRAYQDSHPGATQHWLANETKLGGQSLIGQYLRGFIPLNLKAVTSICSVIGCQPEIIYPEICQNLFHSRKNGETVSATRVIGSNVSPAQIGLRPIPVISSIQAGKLTYISDPYPAGAGYAIEYTDDHDLSRWTFALDVEGESMLPEFRPGDRIIVDPEVTPNPGDFVVARNGSDEATFKKYRPRGMNAAGEMVFELVPLNADYATMRSDVEQLTIIGVVVEHRKKYRRRK